MLHDGYPTMPESLVLVRHGESESNYARTMFEQGVPLERELEMMAVHTSLRRLTRRGVEQAQQAGEWLRIYWLDHGIRPEDYRYFVSDYVRAVETAGHLGLNGLWRLDSRIVERNWGDLDQLTYGERVRKFAHELEERKDRALYWRPANGETFQDVLHRLHDMRSRLRRSPARRVIMVCHGEVMWVWRMLLERWTGSQLRDEMLGQNDQTHIHNCRIIEYSRLDQANELQSRFARVRLVDPADPDNPERNRDWQPIEYKLWSDNELLAHAEEHECFVPAEAAE